MFFKIYLGVYPEDSCVFFKVIHKSMTLSKTISKLNTNSHFNKTANITKPLFSVCMFPHPFITLTVYHKHRLKMTALLFCSFPFTVIVLVQQKAGYEKSDKKTAFCLGLSRSLVWDSRYISSLMRSSLACLQRRQGWSPTFLSQVPRSSLRSAVPTSLLLLLPTQSDKQRKQHCIFRWKGEQ